MKRWLAAIAILIVAAGIALYLSRSTHELRPVEKVESQKVPPGPSALEASPQSRPTTQSLPPFAASDTSTAPVSFVASGPAVTITAAAPEELLSTNAPKLAPATVLENMRTAIRDYGSMFGGNPVGNNAEITRALNGDNPKQAKFLRPDSGLRINGKGELIDPWGTPLFFHQISGSETEIRSAGPDKVMWTSDDLIIK